MERWCAHGKEEMRPTTEARDYRRALLSAPKRKRRFQKPRKPRGVTMPIGCIASMCPLLRAKAEALNLTIHVKLTFLDELR